jgi:hypothetical protein
MRACLRFLARPDVLLDLHVYGGLLVAAWGGWHIHWQWACVSLGLALVALGLWGAQRSVHHDPRPAASGLPAAPPAD